MSKADVIEVEGTVLEKLPNVLSGEINKKYEKKSHPACRMAFSLYVFLCIHPQ